MKRRIDYCFSHKVIYFFAILIQFNLISPNNSLSPDQVANYDVMIEQCKQRSSKKEDFQIIESAIGENAKALCKGNEDVSQLMWFRSAEGNGTPTFIPFESRDNSRRFAKGDETKLLTLNIMDFRETDESCYECQITRLDKSIPDISTKFIKVNQRPPTQGSTIGTELTPQMTTNSQLPAHQSTTTWPPSSPIPTQWSNSKSTLPTIPNAGTTFGNASRMNAVKREHFEQTILVSISIALLTLVNILLACLVIKWCNDRKRGDVEEDVESLQNDEVESETTALDCSTLPLSPSNSGYKPILQPSHTNNVAFPAYIVKVPTHYHSQPIDPGTRRLETIHEDYELQLWEL